MRLGDIRTTARLHDGTTAGKHGETTERWEREDENMRRREVSRDMPCLVGWKEMVQRGKKRGRESNKFLVIVKLLNCHIVEYSRYFSLIRILYNNNLTI